MNTQAQQIAQTILAQLGGNRFLMMTGSKNLVATGEGLRMQLTKNSCKAKWLYITLNGSDLYDMEFVTVDKNLDRIVKKQHNDVYCDQLQELFTEATGLYTSL